MDLQALLAQANDLATLTDAELIELRDNLRAAATELGAGDLTDEVLADLQAVRAAVAAIGTTLTEREADADRRQAEAAQALADINAEDSGPEDEPEPEAEDEAPEPEVEEVAAPAPEAEAPAPEAEPAPVPVAAAAAPRVGRVAARRPALPAPPQPLAAAQLADVGQWGLVASANLPNFRAGEQLNDAEKVAAAFMAAIEATAGYTQGPRVKLQVARAGREAARLYPADRFLGRNAGDNQQRISQAGQALAAAAGVHDAGTLESRTAAGGICAPPAVRYDQPVVGTEARPFRDSLLRFGADRGGVTTLPPPIITELEDAVSIWTLDNDTTPGSDGPATKPCLTVTCPTEDTTFIQAITKCLKFGNFRAQYWAEQIDAWVRLAAVQWARQAETELITQVATLSTQNTSGQLLGATRDVLAVLDRATAQSESFHRAPDLRWTWAAPFWLQNMIRTDLAREMPGSSDERLATADAKIASFFASRGISPTWILDGEAGQVFTNQGDGPIEGYPSVVVTYLFQQGSVLGLDGGMLDFGIVRDSTLIETNDVLMFSESMEAAHFHGAVQPRRIAMDLCPDGTTSGTSDIDPCSTGS